MKKEKQIRISELSTIFGEKGLKKILKEYKKELIKEYKEDINYKKKDGTHNTKFVEKFKQTYKYKMGGRQTIVLPNGERFFFDDCEFYTGSWKGSENHHYIGEVVIKKADYINAKKEYINEFKIGLEEFKNDVELDINGKYLCAYAYIFFIKNYKYEHIEMDKSLFDFCMNYGPDSIMKNFDGNVAKLIKSKDIVYKSRFNIQFSPTMNSMLIDFFSKFLTFVSRDIWQFDKLNIKPHHIKQKIEKLKQNIITNNLDYIDQIA